MALSLQLLMFHETLCKCGLQFLSTERTYGLYKQMKNIYTRNKKKSVLSLIMGCLKALLTENGWRIVLQTPFYLPAQLADPLFPVDTLKGSKHGN